MRGWVRERGEARYWAIQRRATGMLSPGQLGVDCGERKMDNDGTYAGMAAPSTSLLSLNPALPELASPFRTGAVVVIPRCAPAERRPQADDLQMERLARVRTDADTDPNLKTDVDSLNIQSTSARCSLPAGDDQKFWG
jgi:hypothetical protein